MNVAQRTVVHVDCARPSNLSGIETQVVAVKQMGVNQRCEQIMRRRDGVEIAVEMEIDFRAGLDLRKTAACGTALHSKNGTERRFARGNNNFLADMRKTLSECNGSDGLALSRCGRGCGRNKDQFSTALERRIGKKLKLNFAAL